MENNWTKKEGCWNTARQYVGGWRKSNQSPPNTNKRIQSRDRGARDYPPIPPKTGI